MSWTPGAHAEKSNDSVRRITLACDVLMRGFMKPRRLAADGPSESGIHFPGLPFVGPETRHAFRTGTSHVTEVAVRRGLLRHPTWVDRIALDPRSRHYLITDRVVDVLHGRRLHMRLREVVPQIEYLVVPEGEAMKSLEGYASLAREVLARGPDEGTTLIALGGGVIASLVGMVAATLYRGVRLVHLPTTLMAQCDASIGHEQSIDADEGKNLLGAYYAPDAVLVDPDLLKTLPRSWRVDGFAEVLKHALVEDDGYLDFVLDPSASIDDLDFVTACIERNITRKCALLERDPSERQEGLALHYGHTIGHAIEHLSDYAYGHGESVAVGMVFAAELSRSLGHASDDLVELHRRLFERYELPTDPPEDLLTAAVLRTVRAGKRCTGDVATMALLSEPGKLVREGERYGCEVELETLGRVFDGLRSGRFAGQRIPLSEPRRAAS